MQDPIVVPTDAVIERDIPAECTLLHRTIDSIHVKDTLANRNPNPRDDKVSFEPIQHKYSIKVDGTTPGVSYQSVTTWNSTHFESFKEDEVIVKMMKSKGWKEGHKYWGMSEIEIKQQWADIRDVACLRGELMHKSIEAFMNLPCKAKSGGRDIAGVKNSFRTTLGDLLQKSQTIEFLPPEVYSLLPVQWEYFLRYVKDHAKLVPFRTEWRIFDEDIKICGTIDMVYLSEDGTLRLHDWKASKEIKTNEPVANFRRFATTPCLRHIPDLNYWHYVLQLNSYKYLLESKYGYKVSSMALVRIHESAHNYELLEVPVIAGEMLAMAQLRFSQINGKI
jgi:hypothetical protein